MFMKEDDRDKQLSEYVHADLPILQNNPTQYGNGQLQTTPSRGERDIKTALEDCKSWCLKPDLQVIYHIGILSCRAK